MYIFALIPLLGVTLIALLSRSLDKRKERSPFIWTILLFLLSFLGLGLIVFPYIIFIGFLIPIMLAYNIYQYIVFGGKVTGKNYGG